MDQQKGIDSLEFYKQRCKELEWENEKLKKDSKHNEKVFNELMRLSINLIKEWKS